MQSTSAPVSLRGNDAPPNVPLFDEREWTPIRQSLHLSERESEIVLGLMAGEKEASIAKRLGISSNTVHCHITRLYRKLHVNSRPNLLIRVFNVHLEFLRRQR
jgi:DNA-binding NarL/FixJ family response regulator